MEQTVHLRRLRPSTAYMEAVQQDINPVMRSILVDWLVEVAQEYKLVSDTLFLAVSFLDRFLSVVPTKRNRLQLVGVGAMLVAAKYEEIYAPQISEFCFITDNTYSRQEVLQMERDMLDILGFELTVPTAKIFLRRYVKATATENGADYHRCAMLAAYLAELTLPDYESLQFLPSQIAASAVLLTNHTLGRPAWSSTMQHYTSYQAADLELCTRHMQVLFCRASAGNHSSAIRDKYNHAR
eukprot:jgi/Astpho2/9791/fgenesh1_pm.00149_%23_28_t